MVDSPDPLRGRVAFRIRKGVGAADPLVLAAGNGPNDQKWLFPRSDRLGQWGIRRLMGQILPASKEPQEGSALLCGVVADRSAQHRIAGLEGVQD